MTSVKQIKLTRQQMDYAQQQTQNTGRGGKYRQRHNREVRQ